FPSIQSIFSKVCRKLVQHNRITTFLVLQQNCRLSKRNVPSSEIEEQYFSEFFEEETTNTKPTDKLEQPFEKPDGIGFFDEMFFFNNPNAKSKPWESDGNL